MQTSLLLSKLPQKLKLARTVSKSEERTTSPYLILPRKEKKDREREMPRLNLRRKRKAMMMQLILTRKETLSW